MLTLTSCYFLIQLSVIHKGVVTDSKSFRLVPKDANNSVKYHEAEHIVHEWILTNSHNMREFQTNITRICK